MHMLKPVLSTQHSLKDRHSFTSPTQPKHPNQQNKSLAPKTYTPYHHKYPHGIDLSLKTAQNRQTPKQIVSTNTSQQHFDGYLQKVIKSNFQKIALIRNQHEKERQTLIHQIMSLKTQNVFLKAKVQQQSNQINTVQTEKSKQLSHPQEKKLLSKFPSQRMLSPNPEKQEQKECLIKNMREKMQAMANEIEECRKRNQVLSLQKKNLNCTLEKLQKQSYEKLSQLEKFKKTQQKVTKEINQITSEFQSRKIQYETENSQLLKQIEKLKREKDAKKQKQKERQRKHSQTLNIVQEEKAKGHSQQKNSGVDKRVIKHFENQIKERDAQLCDKNTLIAELNEKIMSNALLGLNTKYKYLYKA